MSWKSHARKIAARGLWHLRRGLGDRLPLVQIPPCYHVVPAFTPDSVIVDGGLGCNADFSCALLKQFPVRAVGFDPTPRHLPSLSQVASAHGDRLMVVPKALAPEGQTRVRFFASEDNVSGSMYRGHRNVLNDRIQAIEVEAISLRQVLREFGANADLSLVKLDVEGAEYSLLEELSDAELRRIPQWVVEYHHDTVRGMSFWRTLRHVHRFRKLDFLWRTFDSVNFVFVSRSLVWPDVK